MLDTIKNAWKVEDLRKKILYTLMIVLIYRIGSAIPVPFLDSSVLSGFFASGSFLGYLDILSGGAFSSATLFALSISPYITSSIVIQLLTVAIPALEAMSKEGADGRKKLSKITRYVTVGLSVLQAIAYYVMNRNYGAVTYTSGFNGVFTGFIIVLSFAAGAMMVVWLGEQVDKHGIGNGISIILFAGIVSRGPATLNSLVQYWELASKGGQPQYYILVPAVVLLFLALIAAIVLMTNSERRIPVQYAKRVVGRKMYGGQSSYIPIKVMMSGVMPIIFASSLLSIPSMIRSFIDPDRTRFVTEAGELTIAGRIWGLFEYNSIFYAVLYLFLIIAFNYFYVAIQYNPLEMANNLRKNNGAIPGIRPGKPTSDFITRVISKITLVGALFVALIAILPIILGGAAGMNIALGGTSIIIVVGVALDTVRQLESQMMMRHYKGFLE